MRDETSVLLEILNWAERWDNVRAVILNGSRAVPGRSIDELSDYDVAVFVRDLAPVTANDGWIESFGSVIVRWPLRPESTFDPNWITQLALFEDGVRIDFQFTSIENLVAECPSEYLCVLIDKDDTSSEIKRLPVEGVSIERPTEEEFADRVNAFWWDIPYVAKALRRGELDYAKYVLDADIRFQKLQPLLHWYIGVRYGWDIDVGIFGRWIPKYIDSKVKDVYMRTYSGADPVEIWTAVFASMELVRLLGEDVANRLGFEYPIQTDERVSDYIAVVRDAGQACNEQ